MLTAMDILSQALDKDIPNRLAFVALAGEPWDYMGSRRMLLEMSAGEHSIFGNSTPFELSSIAQVCCSHSWAQKMVTRSLRWVR